MIGRELSNKIYNMSIVCAMLVVILHIDPNFEVCSFGWCLDRLFNDGIGRVAVPFFFLVSGFFLAQHVTEEGWWRRAISSRFRTLFVPYLIWNLLWLMMPLAIAVFSNLANGRDMTCNIVLPAWGGGYLYCRH